MVELNLLVHINIRKKIWQQKTQQFLKYSHIMFMKSNIFIPDLAIEAVDEFGLSKKLGVKVENLCDGVTKSTLAISSEEDANQLHRRKGNYCTLDCFSKITEKDIQRELAKGIKKSLCDITTSLTNKRPIVLVVGLGNRNISADALGPLVVDELIVTRNIFETQGAKTSKLTNVSAISTGVFAMTGVEAFDIVKGVADRIGATLIIAIDTLATTKMSRVFKSFQLTDAGIEPASAYKGGRQALTQTSLGIPTVAIGVPMAIYARALISDSVLHINRNAGISEKTQAITTVLGEENISMLVTPKDIEAGVKICAKVIVDGINLAYQNTTEKKYFSYF